VKTNQRTRDFRRLAVIFLCRAILLRGGSGYGMDAPRPVIAIPLTPFLEVLMRSDSLVVQTYYTTLAGMQLLDLGSLDLAGNDQQLHRVGESLYVHIYGSGVLYAADIRLSRDSLVFRRLDATFLRGYNNAAFGFVHRGRIHSLGGYGFWRWNGQLRAYQPRMREWEIRPLDREVPVASGSPESFCWHDMRAERLHVLRSIVGNEAVKGEPVGFDETVRVLDLVSGDWSVQGVATTYHRNRLDERRLVAASDSGLLVAHHNRIEYWLFRENRIVLLADPRPVAEITARMSSTLAWMRKGWLYYGHPSKGTVDSLPMHTGMFNDAGLRIHTAGSPIHPQGLLLMGGALVFLFAVGWAVGRQGLFPQEVGGSSAIDAVAGAGVVTQAPGSEDPPDGTMAGPATPVFDAVEHSLLLLLLRNHADVARRTTTLEINRVLGVGNKSLDMQKRKRSDVIRSINRKYRLVAPDFPSDLVVKARSDRDARLSEYGVHADEWVRLRALLATMEGQDAGSGGV